MQANLEPLEGRTLFNVMTAYEPLIEPPFAPALVQLAAASTAASLDGTYIADGTIKVDGVTSPIGDLDITIDKKGKRVRVPIPIDSTTWVIPEPTTSFYRSGKFWVASVPVQDGDIIVQIKDGKITYDLNTTLPELGKVSVHLNGSKTAQTTSLSLSAKTTAIAPLAVSALIGTYNGDLSTAGIPHNSYVSKAVVSQAKNGKLALTTTLKISGFGRIVGKYKFTPKSDNTFTIKLRKAPGGQTRTLTGSLNNSSNLQLTFFVPPYAALVGTLTRK